MLEPREADLPALFLVLVVLPLVTYILLGKWNEAAKKKEKISLLVQLAAEEAHHAEAMTAVSVIPVASSSKIGFHECARCFGPATTRCSRCKSVRYCSGKCQIIHWRQGHKEECQQLEATFSNSSPKPFSIEESVYERALPNENQNSLFYGYDIKQPMQDRAPLDPPPISSSTASTTNTTIDTSQISMMERKLDKRVLSKLNREILKREDAALFGSSEEAYGSRVNCPPSKKASIRHKLGNENLVVSSEEISKKHDINRSSVLFNGRIAPRSTMHENHRSRGQTGCIYESNNDSTITRSLYSEKSGASSHEVEMDFSSDRGNFLREGLASTSEAVDLNSSPEMVSVKGSMKSKSLLHPLEPKISVSPKSMLKASIENTCSGIQRKGRMSNESGASKNVLAKDSNVVSDTGLMRMMGLRKLPKLPRQDVRGVTRDSRKKNKVLFPYEEFVRFFQCEVWDLFPRGLLNSGNSCYANAVLQCLTCTKPLIIYLLQRSHSRHCCVKDWCLMCELEQHVMMLREAGGPLSPDRILLHMRSIGCRMGSGNQEDAHEFLRLLVTSMQFICLKGLVTKKQVDSSLQETTFIQHTFGGHLRSKVKCLRCHHESERYENIMDLTLEIHGWVNSLEDALTHFTAPEDLDGENMYRCGRCATYVKARKQLNIHEAPNILTIVLKRFQKGRYGKINKCITFPDMLDMIPFMTGTGDSPPLYMLYAVVVHLDTLNASFSGHYVSYVKDMQDTWFRIDDTEVINEAIYKSQSTVTAIIYNCFEPFQDDLHLQIQSLNSSGSHGSDPGIHHDGWWLGTQVQPVPMSQVMSEGAYILFYSRSWPRPPRASSGRNTSVQCPYSAISCKSKTQKSLIPEQGRQNGHFFASEPSSDPGPKIGVGSSCQTSNDIPRSANRNILPVRETYAESMNMEFSDATSSDWSLFTSSDEASFTTESTRDSFSTVDYADTVNLDPISSIFNSFYAPDYSSHSTASCRRFMPSKPLVRFLSEDKGFVWDSFLSAQPLDRVQNGDPKQVSVFSEPLPCVSNCGMSVKYGSNSQDSFLHTTGHVKSNY